MKTVNLYHPDDFEARMSTALVGTGATFFGMSSVAIHLDKMVSPDTLLTTAQAIELIGAQTLAGVLGCAIGAALGHALDKHYAPQVRASMDIVRKINFADLPRAIGNEKGTVKIKLQQIAGALERKAQQIAQFIKHQSLEQNQNTTISR